MSQAAHIEMARLTRDRSARPGNGKHPDPDHTILTLRPYVSRFGDLNSSCRARVSRTQDTLAFASSLLAGSGTARADDEITLFDGRGRASAYIAPDDEGTIYLWRGKPVAYLDADSAIGFQIGGFNGKHLGWFVDGIVRAHDGNAPCAVKERLRSTQFEPF